MLLFWAGPGPLPHLCGLWLLVPEAQLSVRDERLKTHMHTHTPLLSVFQSCTFPEADTFLSMCLSLPCPLPSLPGAFCLGPKSPSRVAPPAQAHTHPLTLLTGLHPTLLRGLRAPKGRR